MTSSNFEVPLDKQQLKIKSSKLNSSSNVLELWPNTAAVHFITPDSGAFLGLEEYLNNVSENYLKEWSVTNTNIVSEEIITKNYYNPYLGRTHSYHENSINLVLDINRNSKHYIYKIIILFFCTKCCVVCLWIPTQHRVD